MKFDPPENYLTPSLDAGGDLHCTPVGDTLRQWMAANWASPYLNSADKAALSEKTGLEEHQVRRYLTIAHLMSFSIFARASTRRVMQIANWFKNERKRVWLPMKKHAVQKAVIALAQAKLAMHSPKVDSV